MFRCVHVLETSIRTSMSFDPAISLLLDVQEIAQCFGSLVVSSSQNRTT